MERGNGAWPTAERIFIETPRGGIIEIEMRRGERGECDSGQRCEGGCGFHDGMVLGVCIKVLVGWIWKLMSASPTTK